MKRMPTPLPHAKVHTLLLSLLRTVKSLIVCKKLAICEWDMQTLLVRCKLARLESQAATVTKGLKKYTIDVAALWKVVLAEDDNFVDHGYTSFYSGKKCERREAEDGIAIKNSVGGRMRKT